MKPSKNTKTLSQPKNPRDSVDLATVRRLLGYLRGRYKARFILVLVLILCSAIAGVAGSLFIGNVIDDYITPLLGQLHPDFAPLLRAITVMGVIYLAGVLSTLFYNRVMVTIAQGVLKNIRDEQFAKMQRLPLRYFDTHSHGDIMSRYTNDTDTLRQMISQSIPQTFSSLITIISVFCAMLATSLPLTVLVVVTIYLMLKISGKIGG
ncbi:MAG: ABC transporter ATP-binding protein, partial [Eubacteriaceae bacterium]|nr:ABC transporter ATP-binding protein [Eubacteriaceae bacterium]